MTPTRICIVCGRPLPPPPWWEVPWLFDPPPFHNPKKTPDCRYEDIVDDPEREAARKRALNEHLEVKYWRDPYR